MQWLAELCVKRPVFATVLILSLTVIGAFSFIQLGVDRYPKVDIPTVLITTVQTGAAPEQIETEVTDKIEEAVNTISGIDELRSTSSEGVSIVTVGFLLEKDGDIAAQEVRDKVNGVLPLLPKTIQQPRVDRFDPDSAPVLSLALTANRPVREITEYADKVIRRQLESLEGVGQVLLVGGRARQINIRLDADRLRAYNVTVTDVSRALSSQNAETPGGRMDQGPQSVTLRTRGRVQTVQEFNDIVVKPSQSHPVKIADIGAVEDGMADLDTIATINGTSTVLLNVRRQSGTNTVQVAHDTKERIKCNFGMANPEGYRKALRCMKLAEKFRLPVVTLIDTPGAYPGIGAEERGVAESIARNLFEMSRLRTPIVTVVIGEGCSGGAIGIGVADRVAIMEFGWYSVIGPEACSAILFKGNEGAPQLSDSLRLTSNHLKQFDLVDTVINEPLGGAHRDPRSAAHNLEQYLAKTIRELTRRMKVETLIERRYEKFRKMGVVLEKTRRQAAKAAG